ncbi:hypothetical protein HKX48_004324 [Thoreauomyces humboldtii]|nr:hypothetical protein HKX48_004324 [Thoreauomyces humboldtii]
MCGVNAVGRILAGLLADRIGRINAQVLLIFVSGVTCLVLWTSAKSFGMLLFFTLAFGLTGGGYWALVAPAVAEIVGLTALPGALSIVFLVNVIPLIFAGPIADAIYDGEGSTSYLGSILFTGCALCGGALLLLGTKFAKNPKIWAKV